MQVPRPRDRGEAAPQDRAGNPPDRLERLGVQLALRLSWIARLAGLQVLAAAAWAACRWIRLRAAGAWRS